METTKDLGLIPAGVLYLSDSIVVRSYSSDCGATLFNIQTERGWEDQWDGMLRKLPDDLIQVIPDDGQDWDQMNIWLGAYEAGL